MLTIFKYGNCFSRREISFSFPKNKTEPPVLSASFSISETTSCVKCSVPVLSSTLTSLSKKTVNIKTTKIINKTKTIEQIIVAFLCFLKNLIFNIVSQFFPFEKKKLGLLQVFKNKQFISASSSFALRPNMTP